MITVRFALPTSERPLARRRTRVVLVDPAGWEDLACRRALRRGLMLPAGPQDLLAEPLADLPAAG